MYSVSPFIIFYYTGQASASESDSFAMKDFGYFLLRKASARLAHTDLDDLLI